MEILDLKNRLKQGEIIRLNNEEHQFSIGDDDVSHARLHFTKKYDWGPSWAHGWHIWFNGKLIHHSKTFKSFEKRLTKLIEKWDLYLLEQEN
jgi:hypothetical protein